LIGLQVQLSQALKRSEDIGWKIGYPVLLQPQCDQSVLTLEDIFRQRGHWIAVQM
jgi:hypothetical protein